MKLVLRKDIETWALDPASKSDLPWLISKLVRATTQAGTQVDIDTGSAIYIGGWDGKVVCPEKTDFVPAGISFWEFGTEGRGAAKIRKDFAKRDKDPLGESKQISTLVLVTSRVIGKKEQLEKELQENSEWKEVKVYDSRNLEQWLERCLAVSRWLASRLRVLPFDGYQTADEFWEDWSVFKSVQLVPGIVTAGRQANCEQLLRFLQGKPDILAVKAPTKNEATAFIIAAVKQSQSEETERFFSKALIVDTVCNYNGIITNQILPSNLIPTFEDRQALFKAVNNGHHVIVPLAAGDTFSEDLLFELPAIDRDGQVAALMEMGYKEEKAHKLSKEAGRDVTILKKLLNFPPNKTRWLDTEDPREIIPALLVGRWNENRKGDREILERFAGKSYDDYTVVLNKWRELPESPILQIGEKWRLTSPWDVWTSLPRYLTKRDMQTLQNCVLYALQDGNPLIELDPDEQSVYFRNQEKKFSSWVREGLLQSMVLVGTYGERLKVPGLLPQQWVDSIVFTLLQNADGKLWQSINYECPLLAEASPDSFLRAVQLSLEKEDKPILEMFREWEGISHKQSSHVGLLWALEGLSWLPDYFEEATLLLLRLAALDLGGSLTNRPFNSLHNIFNSWHPQTLMSLDGRMQVLERITRLEPVPGWKLLMNLLPQYWDKSHPIHTLRWRMFSTAVPKYITYGEMYDTHSQVLKMLIDLFDQSEEKFTELIRASERMLPEDRALVLNWANERYQKVSFVSHTAWHQLRDILHRHRSYRSSEITLPESELQPYEWLYHKLQPADTWNQLIWLFNDSWPEFPEGSTYDAENPISIHNQEEEVIANARLNAVRILVADYGLKKIIALRVAVKEPHKLGEALAATLTSREDILAVCQTLTDEEPAITFSRRFLNRKALTEGWEWMKNLCYELIGLGFSDKAIANALIHLDQGFGVWDFVASLGSGIERLYWMNVYPFFYNLRNEEKIFGLQKLTEYQRFVSAVEVATYQTAAFPSDLLIRTLQTAFLEKSVEPQRLSHSHVNHIFEELDKREDRDELMIASLEWQYLPAFSLYTPHRPKLLHKKMSTDPEFFMEILKCASHSGKQKGTDTALGEASNEKEKRDRQTRAIELLHSWKQIPGVAKDHSIDERFLKDWLNKVRQSAATANLLVEADRYIGKVLAQYPENVGQWPAEPLFKVLQDSGSDTMIRNYSSALFNKRGFSSRGMFAGGDIERGHAGFFFQLAEVYRAKFPKVAKEFRRLANGYLSDAGQHDNSAMINKLEY